MKVKHFLYLILFLISNLSQAQFRTETKVLKIENLDRSFEIFVPRNYSSTKNYPLVFVLHGGAGTGKKCCDTQKHNLSVVQSQKLPPKKPVSVLFINGTTDPLVPYKGGNVTVFKQKRGKILSVNESVKVWRDINNCSIKTEDFDFPDVDKSDDCSTDKRCWINAKNSKIKVALVRIENGGHTWPGTNSYLPKKIIGNTNGDFNACNEIWEFFKSTK